MLKLDVATLAFSAAMLSLAAALVIQVFGAARRGDRRWGAFALSAMLYGTGVLVILGLTTWSRMGALLVGNLLVMLSAVALHVGVCRLTGDRDVWWAHGVLVVLFLVAEGMCLVRWDDINLRIAIVSLARVPILLHAALLLRRARQTGRLRAAWLVEGVVGVWALLLLGRGLSVLGWEGTITDFPAAAGVQAFYFGMAGFGNLAIAIALLRMDGEMVSAALAAQVARQTEALERRLIQNDADGRLIRGQLALRDALIDTLPTPVFAKDREGRFLAVNRALERDLGLSREALIGKTSLELHGVEIGDRHGGVDCEVLSRDGAHTFELPIRYADGTLRRVLFCKARFYDPEGEVAGIVGSLTDISELSRITEDLRRSEADLRAILDNMTDIFYRADSEGRLLMLSRSVETVLGYPVAALLGRPIAEVMDDPGAWPTIIAVMETNGGSVTDFESRMRHRDGHVLWVSASTRLLRDPDGRRTGSEGTLRLIDDRKRTEASLRENQSLIQALINCSADATLLVDASGTLLACNAVLADRLGVAVETLIGSDLWSRFPPDLAAHRRAVVQAVIDSGVATRDIDRNKGRVFDNSIYPVADSEGRITQVALFSRDVTDRIEAEARIAHHMAEVERSNAELEQFAYVASHDLREPLRMISSYLSLIERRYEGVLDPDGREFLGYAREGARRMDRLVLDLLDYARIGRATAPATVIPVAPAIAQAIRDLDPVIAGRGAQVLVEDETAVARVRADGAQVARLFQNLVGNALKYCPEDRRPQIRIGCRREGAMWRFEVADNGIGIEAQYFERIFRIFQRLHPQNRYEGTGIGLAICKRIVDCHGGEIGVRSTPGEGAVFSFTLPAE